MVIVTADPYSKEAGSPAEIFAKKVLESRGNSPRLYKNTLAFLAIDSSPAVVRSPHANCCAERFIRTLKENLLWMRTFKTI